MPSTAPIDRDVLSSLRLGDEQALERLFRDSYPTLRDRARAELDDPSAAPRVVEDAFLRAWAHRTEFESPESLERFLQRSVHECAVREKSRRNALHRFEQREGVKVGDHVVSEAIAELPVDTAWAHVSAAIHAPPVDAEHAAHVRHDVSRHHSAEHIGAIAKRPAWIAPLALAAVLAAAFLVGMRWMDRTSDDVRVTRALAAQDVRVRATRPGEQANMTLTDGSRAAVAGDSKLTIPPSFGEGLRALALEGAASFTVASNAAAAFHVRTPQATVTATGTAFDVRAYAGEGRTLVRVREGSVTVRAGEQSRAVGAGEAIDVRSDGSMRPVGGQALAEGFAWAAGRLVLTDRPLREALVDVKRAFGLTLEVPDAALLDRKVSANVELGSSRALIAELEKSGQLAFGYEAQKMVLRDAKR